MSAATPPAAEHIIQFEVIHKSDNKPYQKELRLQYVAVALMRFPNQTKRDITEHVNRADFLLLIYYQRCDKCECRGLQPTELLSAT